MAPSRTLTRQRAELEKEWTRWASTAGPRARVRPESSVLRNDVALSWQRSLHTVDPDRTVAPGLDRIDDRWAESPLRGPVTELAGQMRSIAEDAKYLAVVSDAAGTILWSGGDRRLRRQAEDVNFAPGGCWDESHMGTNGLSLALHDDRPVTVFSAEHLVAALHGWVCYSAPIHAPDGKLLGVLDLSSVWSRSHPMAMASVRSLVTAVETVLRTSAPPPAAGVRLECLGTARLLRDGRPVPLPPRQLEILALLALEPEGYTPEQLHAAVYGDRPVSTNTLKADVSHLRRATGGEIANRRYMLTGPLSCDAVDLLAAITAGDTSSAVWHYRGPLLPGSDTPGVVEWRDYLDVGIRTAVLASDRPEHAIAFGERAADDIAVHEHALRLLPADDVRRAVVAARLHNALHG
ncbi:transcriptional regulator [Nocardia amikacinitolerans]|uniref:transcriptional regulator n=1 Tax=Nocardia amikacinitolerans TaxID=756689 RepID=UPI0020A593C6|nr:transcriptional regulator [Nocardia amikacinitolerans]MCP2276033.1 Transcriptional regulatory protein, C terminal [Nocardia amikacinitolerans]